MTIALCCFNPIHVDFYSSSSLQNCSILLTTLHHPTELISIILCVS